MKSGRRRQMPEIKRFASLFSARLRRLREHLGLRQADVAEKIGVSVPLYSLWEGGSRTHSVRLCDLVALAGLYKLTVASLVDPGSPLPTVGDRVTPAIVDHAACDPHQPSSMCEECRLLWFSSIASGPPPRGGMSLFAVRLYTVKSSCRKAVPRSRRSQRGTEENLCLPLKFGKTPP